MDGCIKFPFWSSSFLYDKPPSSLSHPVCVSRRVFRRKRTEQQIKKRGASTGPVGGHRSCWWGVHRSPVQDRGNQQPYRNARTRTYVSMRRHVFLARATASSRTHHGRPVPAPLALCLRPAARYDRDCCHRTAAIVFVRATALKGEVSPTPP